MKQSKAILPDHTQILIQQWVGLLCALGMTAGFLFSRALLSISMIVLLANSLWPATIANNWKRFCSNRFALFCALYFLLYVVSGLWSEDKHAWWQFSVLKLPFLILPFGIWSIPFHIRKYRSVYIISMLAVIGIMLLVSLCIFFLNRQSYVNSYAYAPMIPSTRNGDHIRFSLWLSCCLLIIARTLRADKEYWNHKKWRWFFISIAVLIIVYLHFLAAKTGIIALYIVLVGLSIHTLSQKWNKAAAGIVTAVTGIAFFSLFYFISPTFRAKITYTLYELHLVKTGFHLDRNYTDMGRLISYEVALSEIDKMPAYGTGAGDILASMDAGYQKLYPNVPPDERYVPINQYLTEVLGFGWWLSGIFIVMILLPFFARLREDKIYLTLTTLCFLLGMMTEAMLHIQMGVFVYLFLTLFWYVLHQREAQTSNHSQTVFT